MLDICKGGWLSLQCAHALSLALGVGALFADLPGFLLPALLWLSVAFVDGVDLGTGTGPS